MVLTATHLAIVMEYAASGDSVKMRLLLSLFLSFIICNGSNVLMYQLFYIQLYPNQVLASGQRMLGDGVMP